MACLQYFLPGVMASDLASGGQLNRPLLEERGLGSIFADITRPADCPHFELAGSGGPGGKPGVIIYALPGHGNPPRRTGYFADDKNFEWSPVGDGSKLWICIDRAFPPAPVDLPRRQMIEGHAVKLDDGNEWIVPVIRRWGGGTRLPRSFSYDSAGKLLQAVKPGYQAYWERSAAVSDFVYANGSVELQWAVDTCLDLLGLNYRLGRNEQTVLGLVGSENWRDILRAAVDYPTALQVLEEERLKKKAEPVNSPPAMSSAEPGSTAG